MLFPMSLSDGDKANLNFTTVSDNWHTLSNTNYGPTSHILHLPWLAAMNDVSHALDLDLTLT